MRRLNTYFPLFVILCSLLCVCGYREFLVILRSSHLKSMSARGKQSHRWHWKCIPLPVTLNTLQSMDFYWSSTAWWQERKVLTFLPDDVKLDCWQRREEYEKRGRKCTELVTLEKCSDQAQSFRMILPDYPASCSDGISHCCLLLYPNEQPHWSSWWLSGVHAKGNLNSGSVRNGKMCFINFFRRGQVLATADVPGRQIWS